jgi:hypothetical protein
MLEGAPLQHRVGGAWAPAALRVQAQAVSGSSTGAAPTPLGPSSAARPRRARVAAPLLCLRGARALAGFPPPLLRPRGRPCAAPRLQPARRAGPGGCAPLRRRAVERLAGAAQGHGVLGLVAIGAWPRQGGLLRRGPLWARRATARGDPAPAAPAISPASGPAPAPNPNDGLPTMADATPHKRSRRTRSADDGAARAPRADAAAPTAPSSAPSQPSRGAGERRVERPAPRVDGGTRRQGRASRGAVRHQRRARSGGAAPAPTWHPAPPRRQRRGPVLAAVPADAAPHAPQAGPRRRTTRPR